MRLFRAGFNFIFLLFALRFTAQAESFGPTAQSTISQGSLVRSLPKN